MAKAKKGFGESPERTRPAKDFILAFGECIAEDDPPKILIWDLRWKYFSLTLQL